ncbi:hypothetical protein C8E84_2641 [Ornithinibacter aureus]|nr:hypothetical protein C8E84_2641 [Ornithinibacter aureus]
MSAAGPATSAAWHPTSAAVHPQSEAARPTAPTSRRQIADAGRADIVMGWARGALAVATATVLTLVVARVGSGRSPFGVLTHRGTPGTFAQQVSEFTATVLPGLLVAWCLGFAAAAVAVRATWLGARIAGVLAAALGVVAGTALVVLSR